MLSQLKNKPIIINTDLDGIISGLFLKEYLNCTIIGFSNSAASIWIESDFTNFKEVCFIDLFVANPEIITLDQHIISVNKNHHNILENNAKKINPNLLNNRYFLPDKSYYKKYPFGTIHFLIALLERENYDLTKINFFKKTHQLQFIDFILRADDAMKTTKDSKYLENANQWWKWLVEFSNNGKTIPLFIKYLNEVTSNNSKEIKKNIASLLQRNPFNCNSSEGGIYEITKNNYLKKNVKKYIEFIALISNIKPFNLNHKYKKYNGITERLSLTKNFQEELINQQTINGKKVFSYAFVRSSKRDYNFSVTFYKKKH